MDSKPDKEVIGAENVESQDDNRRDLVRKLGKFAAYAAPFTVLAFTKKADATTTTGPHH